MATTPQITVRSKQISFIAAVALSSIVTMMNTTTVSIAFPTYMKFFNVDIRTVQWVTVAYMLALAMATPLSGYFGHRFSYRKIYLISLIGMGACSICCASAQHFYFLACFRFLKGVFAGLIVPYTMALIYRYIPSALQPHYHGIAVITNSFGAACGPSIAGLVLHFFNWRILFLFNMPLIVISWFLLLHALPKEEGVQVERVDIPGSMLVCFGTCFVLMGFTNLEIWGARSFSFIMTLVIGSVLIIAFIIRQMRAKNPLLNFRTLKSKPFLLCVIVTCCFSTTMSITGISNMLYMQNVLGFSTFKCGLIMFFPALANVLGATIAARLFGIFSSRTLAVTGLTIAAFGNVMMSTCTITTTFVPIIFYLVSRFLGLGLMQMPLTNYGMRSVAAEMSGHASSLLNWTRQMSTTVSVNILTIFLSINTVKAHIANGFGETVIDGTYAYKVATMSALSSNYRCLAIMLGLSAILALFMKNSKFARK